MNHVKRKRIDNDYFEEFSAPGPLRVDGGTETQPALGFTNDSDTGFYQVGDDNAGITTGGSKRFDVSTTAVTSTLPLIIPAGTAGAPSLSFSGDPNTGLFSGGGDVLAISTGGTQRFSVSTSATTSTLPLTLPIGSVGTPSLNFAGDTDTGIYSSTGNRVDFATSGVLRASLDSGGLTTTVPIQTGDGTQAAPAYSFPTSSTSGMWSPGADTIAFGVSNFKCLEITTTGITWYRAMAQISGTAAAPSYTFSTSGTSTGMYRSAGNVIGFSCSGTLRLSVSATSVTSTVPIGFPAYTVLTVPAATTAGQLIYVSDDAGTPSKIMAYSDGTNWLRVDTGAVLS